jgi:hypothetical protein
MAHDVFISHSSRDKDAAEALCAHLEGAGIRCWLAPRDILAGADWGKAIVEAVAAAKAMLLVFSSAANDSDHVLRELEQASRSRVTVVPLRIEDVNPGASLKYYLDSVHWMDAFAPPLAGHFPRLLDQLRRILPGAAVRVVGSPLVKGDPAEVAGRWRLLERLGGTLGIVYKAEDRVLHRVVALKTFHPDDLASLNLGELTGRFERVAPALVRLDHPSVVSMYDAGEADGLGYIAMELVDGIGLDRVLAKEGRLEPARVARIGAQAAEGLAYVHGRRIIHRSLKPSNLLVNERDVAWLTDFGFARILGARDDVPVRGAAPGMAHYTSPEQARGQEADEKSDLFSLGCVLYEALTGKKAFEGRTNDEVVRRVLTEGPMPIRKLASDVPPELAAAVEKALAPSPAARPASASVLAERLRAAAATSG